MAKCAARGSCAEPVKTARAILLALLLLAPSLAAAEEPCLYRATLVQAAPGKLLDLIDLYKANLPSLAQGGDEAPVWMRHSQGDRWDLLLLFPMGSWAEYDRPERLARRKKTSLYSDAVQARLRADVARQEDVFVEGPPLAQVRAAADKAGFFHVEMFEALPGRLADLRREREMEDAYSQRLKRPQNLIFVRAAGAAWDLFTVGCYRDLKHYAESADIPQADQDAAARAAGFASAADIGPYLRTLIALHHDTLATAVR